MQAEVSQWISFASSFDAAKTKLKNLKIDGRLQLLNMHLEDQTVFAGRGVAISLADLSMFAVVHEIVSDEVIPQKKFRSLRHLPYLWIVLGKSALHMTHPAVSPSSMFSMVQWGLQHMAKLVLPKVALCTPDLALKILKFG
jgi:hypothetical protein